MPQKVSHPAAPTLTSARAARPFRVLVVDADPQVSRLLKKLQDLAEPMQVRRAGTLAAARRHLAGGELVDLVVVEQDLPDGSGLELAREIRSQRRRTRTVVSASTPTLDGALGALRAGAIDFIAKPLEREQLADCVRAGMAQRRLDKQQALRARRLRRACRKIDEARADVHEQVEVLCHDLVAAYQELAGQMEQAVSVREFEALVSQELELEPLLRKTLEYLVDRLGPMNAVMFLPCAADEFSLGGHINYDCEIGAAELLLQDLAAVAAPRFAAAGEVVQLSDPVAQQEWLGEGADYFAPYEVLGFSASHEGEALAVMILFRDRAQGFDDPTREICEGVAQVLADALVRLLRVHHRHLPDFDVDGELE